MILFFYIYALEFCTKRLQSPKDKLRTRGFHESVAGNYDGVMVAVDGCTELPPGKTPHVHLRPRQDYFC